MNTIVKSVLLCYDFFPLQPLFWLTAPNSLARTSQLKVLDVCDRASSWWGQGNADWGIMGNHSYTACISMMRPCQCGREPLRAVRGLPACFLFSLGKLFVSAHLNLHKAAVSAQTQRSASQWAALGSHSTPTQINTNCCVIQMTLVSKVTSYSISPSMGPFHKSRDDIRFKR